MLTIIPQVNIQFLVFLFNDEKELCSITQLVEEGVTPHYSFEITFFLSDFLVFSFVVVHHADSSYR